MAYPFREIETKWQKAWADSSIYKVEINHDKPKFYILDMFPYPSGSGLHVGHPLGYIATDIFARYKVMNGFNVLHPMGFDAFGLPAEQYAIQTGRHPSETTNENIERYKEQLSLIGLGYDWSREIRTSDPDFYKWTQWIFLQLFNSFYNNTADRAELIENLVKLFEEAGNSNVVAACDEDIGAFNADEWKSYTGKEKQEVLLKYRMAYIGYAEVNWCPDLGTVLANEEVVTDPEKGLVSERGGHLVEKKPMRQWFLRITAYAERLITDLDTVDFPTSIREMQKNWIGRSEGALISFKIKDPNKKIPVFTTRPDTIYGATFMVLAPEHELVQEITTESQKEVIEKYITYAKNRSERDRLADVKKVTGEFTGAFAINPFTNKEIPIWIADYVLAGYGTGAIMAVPAHDARDHSFAKHFKLNIVEVVEGGNVQEEALEDASGKHVNSGFMDGMMGKEAIEAAIQKVKDDNLGEPQVNYKLRDFLFSRQRYWGEPFPIVIKDDVAYGIDEASLPVLLPDMEDYKPSSTGEPPLSKLDDWVKVDDDTMRETNTMPGWAGSNWYFLRYMDPDNKEEMLSKEAEAYWGNIDLYAGGAEHATGHLIYSRFVYKFLHDAGYVSHKEPYQKLINQGMIQGYSHYIYVDWDAKKAVSKDKLEDRDPSSYAKFRVPIDFVDDKEHLLMDKLPDLKKEFPEFDDIEFIEGNEGFIVADKTMDKMSKSLRNVVNPDEIIEKYGVDTFRMYMMFLGPIQQAKPWDTAGIEGTSRFLQKFHRLLTDEEGKLALTDEHPSEEENKILHKTIKKVGGDVESYDFNTAIAQMMICVNELTKINCKKKSVLKPLLLILSPFAPHLAEEFWSLMGEEGSVIFAPFPKYDDSFLKEETYEYPVAINGKTRTKLTFPIDMPKEDIEKEVLATDALDQWLEGKEVKKVIVVPNRIVNIVT